MADEQLQETTTETADLGPDLDEGQVADAMGLDGINPDSIEITEGPNYEADQQYEEDRDNFLSNHSEQQEESTEDNSEESEEEESEADQQQNSTEDSESAESEGGTSDTGEDDQSSQQAEAEYEPTSEEIFNELSEETGVEISSDEELVQSLRELAQLRDNQVVQQVLEVQKAGGDLAEHFRMTTMDFENMDAREVLRQKYYKDNASLYRTNPELAAAKFDREYKSNYGLWESYKAQESDDDKEFFAEENGMSDINYAKMMLEHDVEEARKELTEWQKTAKPVPVSDQNAENGQLQMTPEEEAEYTANYFKKVESALGDFEAVSIGMGDNLDDFNLGLNDTTRPVVEGWANNPAQFLSDIGFNGSEIDVSRLLPIMTLIAEASIGDLGGRFVKYVTDNENLETLSKTFSKPGEKPSAGIAQGRGEGDDWDAVGEAAEEANRRLEQR